MKSIILLAVLFVSTAVTHAQNNVLFIENFTNGNYDNWEVFDDVEPRSGPSNWVVQNQVLRQTSNIWSYDPPAEFIYHLGTKVIAGDSSWANYSFNAVLRSTDNDGIGMIFRYQDEKNYYRILLMDDAGNSGSTQSAVQRIQKMVDGEPITLLQNEVNEAFPSGNFALSVDVRDDSIKVFLNHSLIGKVKDSEYSSGKIGLFTYANSGAYFDSITVSSDFFIYDEIEEFLPLQPVSQDRLPYIQNPSLKTLLYKSIMW